jgi:hypothetical protein
MRVGQFIARLCGAACVLALAACNNTDTISRNVTIGGPGSTAALLTTADLRLITDRPAVNRPDQRVVCAEPPPDVAKALSTSADAALKVTTQTSLGGQASGSYASAEQLAALAGRVPALLALRDGLFHACEAYGNGIIGDASYALLLSRYGEILVTVVLADAASGTAASTLATLNGLNLIKSGSDDSSTPNDKGSTGSTTPAAKTTAASAAADAPMIIPAAVETGPSTPAAPPKLSGLVHLAKAEIGDGGAAVRLAQAAAPVPKPNPAPDDGDTLKVNVKLPAGSSLTCTATAKAASVGPLDCSLVEPAPAKAKPAPTPAAPKAAATADTKQATSVTESPAAAIGAMQQNYLNLSVTAPLLVACISEYDPTRAGAYLSNPPTRADAHIGNPAAPNNPLTFQTNDLLRRHCDTFLDDLKKASANDAAIRLLNAKAALAAAQKGK